MPHNKRIQTEQSARCERTLAPDARRLVFNWIDLAEEK